MHKSKVKVLSGFRLTIPEEARRRLPIKVGDELVFTLDGKRLAYMVEELPEDPVLGMLGLAKGERRRLAEVEDALVSEIEEKLKRT